MSRSVLVPGALLIPALLGQCKKNEAEQAAEQAAEQVAQVGAICDGMNDLSLAYVAGVMEIEVDSLDAPGKRDELKKACKTMPVEVARCAERLALDDAACDKALESFLGMTDTNPQGEGPKPSWVLEPPFEVFDVEVGADGRVAIAGEQGVGVVDGGGLSWSATLDDGSARVSWWKDQVLTGSKGTLRAFDASGKEAWSKALGDEGTWLSAIEPGPGGTIVVVTDGGTIVRIDGDACAAGSEGCATTVATVEALGGRSVEVLPSGALLASGDSGVALVSATGELLAERAADYDAGFPRGGRVVVGNDVLSADPECAKGSDACLTVLLTVKDLELVAPLAIDGGLVYADTYGVIVSTGTHAWKIDAGNDSDLLTDGGTIYSVGHELGLDAMDAPPQVRAIDVMTGKTRWITTLGSERASLLTSPLAVLQGGQLIVSTRKQLFSLPVGG